MNNLFKGLAAIVLTSIVSTANAGIIDFIGLTESATGYGEGAWTSLNLSTGGANVAITGHATNDNDPQQFAYLDWGRAGLGACKDVLNSSAVDTLHTGSGTNNCSPSSDDNVTTNEFLRFVFDTDVVITNIWFNNNHDGGFGAGDKVGIDGVLYNVATGYAGGANGIGPFHVTAGYEFDVSQFNEQFYISAIEFSAVGVPESSALLLLCFGLLMTFAARQRKQ